MLPELVSRPADVAPVSELIVQDSGRCAARPSAPRVFAQRRARFFKVSRSAENVRTLRNLVIRGALNVAGTELRPEHLEVPWATPAFSGVRAEGPGDQRREIQAALHGSGWNVTEAARRMELLRRTLVYRMSRLGLRRPRGPA